MRRLVGVFATAALAAALAPGVALASPLSPEGGPAFDLRPQLMLRLFGESSDANAALAGAYGDAASESPLRDVAFAIHAADRPATFEREASAPTFATRAGRSPDGSDAAFDVAKSIRSRLLPANVHFAAPSADTDEGTRSQAFDVAPSVPAATFTAGEYQPVAPVTLVSAQSVAFAFAPGTRGTPAAPDSTALAFGGSAMPTGSAGSSTLVPGSVRVGPLQLATRLQSASLEAPSIAMSDNAYGAGANFDVRAGARKLNVDLSSNYERVTRNDASGLSSTALSTSSSWQLPNADVPLVVPNYADLSKVSLGAAVAVPVINGLTLNLNYAADRMFGGYGMPGLTNVAATDNSYGGKLTFEIPHSASTLSISASQLRYQDGLIPANTSTQTREDVNLTVKF
ncbi:MAG: hypothetical protein WB615_14725 [Candidatus Tumulicola sp.]